jgi:hypothetical protein
MDMGGMDMSGGMDMGSSGLFQPTNMAIAWNYWVIIAAVVVSLGLRRSLDFARRCWRYISLF